MSASEQGGVGTATGLQPLIGKHVAVTGGASGIGRATAEVVSAWGAAVSILDVDDTAIEVARGLEGSGRRAAFWRTDVSTETDVAEAMDHAVASFGQLDALVHAAGVMAGQRTLVTEVALDSWRSVIDVNLTGAFLVCKHAARWMVRHRCGVIVLVASQGGVTSTSGSLSYGASKAGVHALAATLHHQLSTYGIRVHDICPGRIDTSLMRQSLAEGVANGADPAWAKEIEQDLANAEGVAKVIAFACSPDASYLRGTLVTH